MAKWSGVIIDPNAIDWEDFSQHAQHATGGHFGDTITTPTTIINKQTGEVMARVVGDNRFYMGHYHPHIAPVWWLRQCERDYPYGDTKE